MLKSGERRGSNVKSVMVVLTNEETGTFLTFGSLMQASDFLGRSKQYIRSRMSDGGDVKDTATSFDGTKYKIEIIGVGKRRDHSDAPKKEKKPENQKYAGNKPQQLCFDCARASGFCPWSKNFSPVEGWTAKCTNINNVSGQEVCSYHILCCPLFIKDAPTKEGRLEQRRLLMEELVNERTSGV